MHVKIFIYYGEMNKLETVVDNKAFAKQLPLTHPQGPFDFPAIAILKSKKTLGLGLPAMKAKHFGPHIKHFQEEIIGPLYLHRLVHFYWSHQNLAFQNFLFPFPLC